MARQQKIYKLDIDVVHQDLAMLELTDGKETTATIILFLEKHQVEVDREEVARLVANYKKIADTIYKTKK